MSLTPSEARLLRHLAWQTRPVDQYVLLEEVWGYDRKVLSKTVKTTVSRLRAKIEPQGDPVHLVTSEDGYSLANTRDVTVHPWERLVGRQAELRQLDALDEPIVVLVGPPGVGKTRLAREWLARSAGEAIFVDLSACVRSADAVAQVAAALGLPGDASAAVVGSAIASTGLRVVLDNLEQLDDTAFVVAWAAPTARVLCTSQHRIGQLPTITLGPLEPDAAADVLLHAGLRVYPQLPRTEVVRAHLRAVAAHLEGLPLALLLAAGWLDLVAPAELLARLQAQEGSGLEQALGHAWARADAETRQDLVRLSVFRSPISLARAEQVLGGRAARAIRSCASRSWLVRSARAFRMLVATRQYVQDNAPDGLDEARRTLLLAWAGDALTSEDEPTAAELVVWGLECHHGAAAAAVTRRLIEGVGGPMRLPVRWGELLTLCVAVADPSDAAWLRLYEASLTTFRDASAALVALLALAETAEADLALAIDLTLGQALMKAFDPRAPEVLGRAATRARALNDADGLSRSLCYLSRFRRKELRIAEAHELAVESRVLAEQCDDPNLLVEALGAESAAQARLGDLDGAILTLRRGVDLPAAQAALDVAILRLATLLIQKGELDEAESLLAGVAVSLRRQGNLLSACTALYRLANVHHERGDHDAALAALVDGERVAVAGHFRRELSAIRLAFVVVNLDRDDVSAARVHLRALQADAEPEAGIAAWIHWRAGQVAHLSGDLAAAEVAYAAALEQIAGRSISLAVSARCWRTLARVTLGDTDPLRDCPSAAEIQEVTDPQERVIAELIVELVHGRRPAVEHPNADQRLALRLVEGRR